MLFASWLYKDDELRDGKKLFPFVFSFSKMMLSFSKRMVSFRKVHWVFFLSLELRSSFEKKNSMDFPSGHHPFASGQHHFASGENNCKKFFAIPQYPHPYIIFWQIKTPDFIFQLLSIISHPFGFILQQTPIQNYIVSRGQLSWKRVKNFCPSGVRQKFFTLPKDNWPKETKFLLSRGTTRPKAEGENKLKKFLPSRSSPYFGHLEANKSNCLFFPKSIQFFLKLNLIFIDY